MPFQLCSRPLAKGLCPAPEQACLRDLLAHLGPESPGGTPLPSASEDLPALLRQVNMLSHRGLMVKTTNQSTQTPMCFHYLHVKGKFLQQIGNLGGGETSEPHPPWGDPRLGQCVEWSYMTGSQSPLTISLPSLPMLLHLWVY